MSGVRLMLLAATAVTVTGCWPPAWTPQRPFVPVVQIDSLPPAQQTALAQMRIYESAQLPSLKFEVLDFIKGYSCQVTIGQPRASRTAAVDQLKAHAAQLGADGITHIQCSGEGTSILKNCWSIISCTAEAIRLTE